MFGFAHGPARCVRRWAPAFLLCMAAGAAAADQIPPQPVQGKIRWVYSYAEGQELARQTGKPMFVVFRCEQ